jgi:hypothetical protein
LKSVREIENVWEFQNGKKARSKKQEARSKKQEADQHGRPFASIQ